MNRKKMITYALLLLCATGLRAMDSDGAAADAAAREGGSELRQRGGAGAGAGGEDPVAAELFGGGDERTILGLTQGQVLGRAARAGHQIRARAGRAGRHLRARDVPAAWRALGEDHRGAEEVANVVCCGACITGAAIGIPAALYWALMAAVNRFADSYPS